MSSHSDSAILHGVVFPEWREIGGSLLEYVRIGHIMIESELSLSKRVRTGTCQESTNRVIAREDAFPGTSSSSEAGSNLRRIDSCITPLKAQGPSRTCNECKEEK